MRAGSQSSLERFPRIKKGLSMNRITRRSAMVRGVGFVVLIVFSATILSGCAHGVSRVKEPTAAATSPSPPAEDQVPGEQSTAEEMVADFLLLRPLGIVATVLGTAFFIASLPFSALGGNAKETFHELVIDPARFTFKRPLGKPEDSQ